MKTLKFIGCLLVLVSTNVHASRERQALEAFDRESLQIEATHFKNEFGRPYASVRDPNGFMHRAFKWDYIGRDFGLIKKISREGIQIREVRQDAHGEWVPQEIWIPVRKKD